MNRNSYFYHGPGQLLIILAVGLLACSGCATYKVQVPPDAIEPGQFGQMEVLTLDGAVYNLEQSRVSDTVIAGYGWQYDDEENLTVFEGSIPLTEVALIQVRHKDALSFLLTATAMIAIYSVSQDGSNEPAPAGSARITSPSYGGGSCPYVYSFDGRQYQLDAEPFAGSICKTLERSTVEVLDHLKPQDDVLNIAFCNQAQESHYINNLDLVAVDHPVGSTIMVGSKGRLHAVENTTSSLWSRSRSSGKITGLLDHQDGQEWQSDLSSVDVAVDSTLVDEIICGFSRPAGANSCKLVLHLANTSLTEFAFDKLLYLCGPATLSWYHSIATEPDQRNLLLGWMLREGCLRVSVRASGRWQQVGLIPHVGGAVPVSRVVELDLAGIDEEDFEIRLQGTTGLWRLDQVAIDWSDQEIGPSVPLALLSLQNENSPLSVTVVAESDAEYLSLYPDDWAIARFAAPQIQASGQYTYVLTAGGHYYNWPKLLGEEDQRAHVRSILAKPYEGSRLFFGEWQKEDQDVVPPVAPTSLPLPSLASPPGSS